MVRAITEGLAPEAFSLVHAGTVAGARWELGANQYDAVILDLALPDGSGLDLADSLRAGGSELPILMLTAKADIDDRVNGFRHGADDYLCKPFALEELVARLHAVLRRARPKHRHILQYADVELDLVHRVVRRQELQATLSAREMDLLAYLMRHPKEVLPRDRILEEIWGADADDESNVLNVYVNYLRNKLERGQYPRLIHTVRKVGYVLSDADPEEDH